MGNLKLMTPLLTTVVRTKVFHPLKPLPVTKDYEQLILNREVKISATKSSAHPLTPKMLSPP